MSVLHHHVCGRGRWARSFLGLLCESGPLLLPVLDRLDALCPLLATERLVAPLLLLLPAQHLLLIRLPHSSPLSLNLRLGLFGSSGGRPLSPCPIVLRARSERRRSDGKPRRRKDGRRPSRWRGAWQRRRPIDNHPNRPPSSRPDRSPAASPSRTAAASKARFKPASSASERARSGRTDKARSKRTGLAAQWSSRTARAPRTRRRASRPARVLRAVDVRPRRGHARRAASS